MGRSFEFSVPSHVFVAISTAFLASCLCSFSFSEIQLADGDVKKTRSTSSFHSTASAHQIDPMAEATTSFHSVSRAATRIDLFSCPDHRLRVAPKVNFMLGMGHKMMTRGYCFCFDTHHFGNDMDLYHLLLEPIFPDYGTMLPNRTLEHTTVKDLEKQNITLLADNETVIQWIYPASGEVWPKIQQEKLPLGHGDVLAFVDSFLRDNRLVEDRRKHDNGSCHKFDCNERSWSRRFRKSSQYFERRVSSSSW